MSALEHHLDNLDLRTGQEQAKVTEQTRLMNQAGSAWHAVKVGNLEKITKLFPASEDVYALGPVGENIFHIAMLLNTPTSLAIARYLIRIYGKTLVNSPYQERSSINDPPGLYEGETALHIAVVNRDIDMVQLLVNSGADVRARAYGPFFNIKGPCYYGEYPLSFAASTGQMDVVSYLKRHGARLDVDADLGGNTALHMCVYHTHPVMFSHLLELGAYEHTPNNDGMSCLLLAAKIGNAEMFEYICNRSRQVAWAYGPVTSYTLAMREIDTVQGSKQNKKMRQSALIVIVECEHFSMLNLMLVKTLFALKWVRFGRTMFLLDLLLHLTAVVLRCVLGVMRCWDTRQHLSMSYTVIEYVLVVLVCVLIWNTVLDFLHSLRRHLNIHRIRHATTRFVPPIYALPATNKGSMHIKVDPPDTKLETREGRWSRQPSESLSNTSRNRVRSGHWQPPTHGASSGSHARPFAAYSTHSSPPGPDSDGAARVSSPGQCTPDVSPGHQLSSDGRVPHVTLLGPVGEAHEDTMSDLQSYADQVWDAVVKAPPAPSKRIINYDPKHYEMFDDLPRTKGEFDYMNCDDYDDGPVENRTNLFDELINLQSSSHMDDGAAVADCGQRGSRRSGLTEREPRERKLEGLATMPPKMQRSAVFKATCEFILKLVVTRADPAHAMLVVSYLCAVVDFCTWASISGHPNTVMTSKEISLLDTTEAAALFTAILSMAYFARGWQRTGHVLMIGSMVTKQLILMTAPYIMAVNAIGFSVAVLLLGPGKRAAVQAQFGEDVTIGGIIWACWQVWYVRDTETTASRVLYAILQNTVVQFATWEVAIVWAFFCALLALTIVYVASAFVVTGAMLSTLSGQANDRWLNLWYKMIIRHEYRLPEGLRQKYRIGQKGYSPLWHRNVYSHQYEDVDRHFNTARSPASA